MKRIFTVLFLVSMFALAGSAFAFEVGDEVEVCQKESEYILMTPDAACEGEVIMVQVTEVQDGQIVVQINDKETAVLPVQ